MTRRWLQRGALAALLAAVLPGPNAGAVRSRGPDLVEAGPLLSRTVLDGNGPEAVRTRAAGPVVEWVDGPSGRTFCALRPLAASARDPEAGTSATHLLWPLFTSRRRQEERSWNAALLLWGRDADVRDPASRWSLTAFPVLALGRSTEGRDYGAVFPLGGHLEEFAGRDSIDFALFPLYAHSTQGDLETWNLLFPLIAWTRGDDESRFRIFPVYGQAREPGIRRRFILWPIWNAADYSAPQHEGYSHLLFPLYGRVHLDNQDTWYLIPPLFRYTRAGERREWAAPWPFVQIRRGGESHKTWIWPLWGIHREPGVSSGFFLWPFGRAESHERPPVTIDRRWLVPFYFDERTVRAEPETPPRVEERRVRVWPLASYHRAGDAVRFRTLELWPLAPVDAVERLYAPFWSLYQHSREDGVSRHELLWGLFRRTRGERFARTSLFPLVSWGGNADTESRRWDLLKGLVGYEQEGDERRWRLLYFITIDP